MKKTIYTSAAFALTTLVSINATATVYHAGSFTATAASQQILRNSFPHGAAISDTIYFTLLAPRTIVSAVAENDEGYRYLLNMNAMLYNSSNTLIASVFTDYSKSLVTGPLRPGDYRLDITAQVGNNYVGLGGGSYHVAIATNTPEPETWAMMLAGLGLVASAARRKKFASSKLANNA
ncbi:MAG: FxDxF family PEP-CTERM protein [Pseudomonadota bacterium]